MLQLFLIQINISLFTTINAFFMYTRRALGSSNAVFAMLVVKIAKMIFKTTTIGF